MFLTSIFQSNCVINLFYIGLDLAVVNLPIAAHEKSVISRSDLGGGGGGLEERRNHFSGNPCKHQPYKFKDCKFNKCLLAQKRSEKLRTTKIVW